MTARGQPHDTAPPAWCVCNAGGHGNQWLSMFSRRKSPWRQASGDSDNHGDDPAAEARNRLRAAPHSMRAIRNNKWAATDKNNFSPNNGNSEGTDNNALNVQTYGDGVTGCQWPRLLLRQEPHR